MKTSLEVIVVALGALACTGDRAETRAQSSSESALVRAPAVPIAAVAPKACGLEGIPQLNRNGIGALQVNTPLDSVKAICTVVRDTIVDGGEGYSERHLIVAIGRDTVSAEIAQDTVRTIRVTRPGLRTPDSLGAIGVGSAAGSLKYLPGANIGVGEGSAFIGVPSLCGLSFEIEGAYALVAGRRGSDVELVRLVSDSARVMSVLIHRCASTASARGVLKD